MKLTHFAIWTNNLEGMKDFYCRYFGGTVGPKYHNVNRGFQSYFVRFEGDAALELMTLPALAPSAGQGNRVGYAHMAFALGSKERVDALTAQLEQDGYTVASRPRTTGDGYYESAVLDPDGNIVELVA